MVVRGGTEEGKIDGFSLKNPFHSTHPLPEIDSTQFDKRKYAIGGLI